MPFRQKLAKASGINESLLPTGYQIIGDVLLLKLTKVRTDQQKKKIASAALSLLPYIKTVCEIKEVRGEFREPAVSILAGSSTITTHKENGVLYRIDVSKVMFSKGNLTERKRLISQIKDGEMVVDMFAGIGYFSLGIAKFSRAKEVMAIEKNGTAYNFLTENIELNGLKNINAICGDCRQFAVSFQNMADRVIMGYLAGTEEFLQHAVFMSKNNGTIHYHNIYKSNELWKKPLEEIKTACAERKTGFRILGKKKVKSYAPKTWHVVVDFSVSKQV